MSILYRMLITAMLICYTLTLPAQSLTPEKLWSLKRLSSVGVSNDGKSFIYKSSTPNIASNSFDSEYFQVELATGKEKKVEATKDLVSEKDRSPSDEQSLISEQVKIKPIAGGDYYPKLTQSDVYIYDQLHYRHWDEWEDGQYGHLLIISGKGDTLDIMKDEPFDCPVKPFGGDEDYTWSPDGKSIVYVCKKLFGTAYVNSTNTDIYQYDLASAKTTNLTDDNEGYDTHPVFSASGVLAWLSMATDGNEADKNDLKVMRDGKAMNLTQNWDGTVDGFIWGKDGNTIYFHAAIGGTVQLFSVNVPIKSKDMPMVKQITNGTWDVTDIVAQTAQGLLIGRSDMNHAKEFYTVDLKSGAMKQLTFANKIAYEGLGMSKVEKRMVATTDGKQMVTWVIYPPDFDPNKKYPTLLYCQGGPQSALSQFYSFRWNFQLMAAQGYIVVAPNRRGMPGHGVEWNAAISLDWGGQAMDDYLSAIDDVAKEPYVDKNRLGCVGASFGGYSAFYLAGIHEGRFKTFISHDGVFDLKSMYGTTEELFFVNNDAGGPYWEANNAAAQKTYREFDPSNMIDKWDTPILIIQGGRDYRVPVGQGLEAFTAAQQKGLKSRLLYFPEENHWILKPQNALVWQNEFYRWLDETLK